MREIKFRFWNKIASRFQPASKYAIDGEGKLVSYDYEMMAYDDPVDFSKTCILAQQYTGLKDKNGVEIYEGDILKIAGWRGASHRVLVKWERVDASDDAGQNMVGFCCFDQYGDAEVIGNIFETSELLKA